MIVCRPNIIPRSIADQLLHALWNDLAWHNVAGNRREYYHHNDGKPYTYGTGPGMRTYQSDELVPAIKQIATEVWIETGVKFEMVFLNGYKDGHDQLGWHADDGVEMDHSRPIVIVSLGAERELMYRRFKTEQDSILRQEPPIDRIKLGHGSLAIMPAGMQQTHQHRIPKAGYICGPRVPLTFRGAAK